MVSHRNTTSPNSGTEHEERRGAPQVQLPPKEEALDLYQIYITYLGPFQQILYEPHMRDVIDHVYFQVSHVSLTTAPRGASLLFSVLATAVLLGPYQGSIDSMGFTIRERLKRCALYIRAAMDCLEQARRRMEHRFDDVQAIVILFFLINHIEAFSPRFRNLMAEAFAVARILGLHQIDAQVRRGQSVNEDSPVVKEMKRRVWWYLVATDWLTSLAAGLALHS